MRISPSLSLKRARFLSGTLLVLSAYGAQAQPIQVQPAKPPEPIILHPQVAPAELMGEGRGQEGEPGALPPVAAPAGGVTVIAPISGSKAVGATQATALRSSLLLGQLLDGGQSVDVLFRGGDLTPEVARYILSERIEPWGQIGERWADSVRRDLAGLVWREGGETLHKQAVAPRILPRYFRLWLADYLSSMGDGQVLAVGEGILKDTPLPLGGDDGQGDKPLAFQTIERMARYLAARGQQAESAKMWERLLPMYAVKGRWNADATVEAARAYLVAGDERKSDELYAQVPQYGVDWFTGIALLDQARYHYHRKELNEARRQSEALIKFVESCAPTSLAQPLRGEAEALHSFADHWKKGPIISSAEEVFLAAACGDGKAVSARLLIDTFDQTPLLVAVEGTSVKASLSQNVRRTPYSFQRELVVQVEPSADCKNLRAAITLSNTQQPNLQVRIPVRLEAQDSITVSAKIIFFGSIKPSSTALYTLSLSSSKSFRVVKVESDTAALQPSSIPDTPGASHTVELKFNSDLAMGIRSGIIRITTDILSQDMIEVPYVVRVQ